MITENKLEQLCLDWFQSIGYVCGYDIAPDGDSPERSDYRQIILHDRLLSCLQLINPHIPLAMLEKVALKKDIFENYVMGIFEKIKNNLLENKSLEELRDALFPKLLSGELDTSIKDVA